MENAGTRSALAAPPSILSRSILAQVGLFAAFLHCLWCEGLIDPCSADVYARFPMIPIPNVAITNTMRFKDVEAPRKRKRLALSDGTGSLDGASGLSRHHSNESAASAKSDSRKTRKEAAKDKKGKRRSVRSSLIDSTDGKPMKKRETVLSE